MVNYVAVRHKLCERLRIPTIEREGVCSSCEWVAQMVHGMVLRHEVLELRIELARARIHFMRMGSRRRIFGSASSG